MGEYYRRGTADLWIEPCVRCGKERWATEMTTGTPCAVCRFNEVHAAPEEETAP